MTKATKKPVSATASMLATAREDLKNARMVVASLRDKVQQLRADQKLIKQNARAERAANREAKAKIRAEKREAAIAKAKARLERLMNPVGAKAKKAAKRPGPTIVTKFDKSGKAIAKTVNGKAVAV